MPCFGAGLGPEGQWSFALSFIRVLRVSYDITRICYFFSLNPLILAVFYLFVILYKIVCEKQVFFFLFPNYPSFYAFIAIFFFFFKSFIIIYCVYGDISILV